jgi:hypothetical protein
VIDENQLSLHTNVPAFVGGGGTRTSYRWGSNGNHQHNLDTLNLRAIWPSVGQYDIPPLEGTDFEPSMLAAWNLPAQRQRAAEEEGAIHFYLDDYRFESLWRNPDKYFPRIQHVGAAITPDYSIFSRAPFATQIWQVYRQRWMGAFWQFNGITVIPSVRWAEKNTYDFVFEGLPYGGVFAISHFGPGSKEPGQIERLIDGLQEMMKRLAPSKLLVYGKLPPECGWLNLPPVKEYPLWRDVPAERGVPKRKTDNQDEVAEQEGNEPCPKPSPDAPVQEPLLEI